MVPFPNVSSVRLSKSTRLSQFPTNTIGVQLQSVNALTVFHKLDTLTY